MNNQLNNSNLAIFADTDSDVFVRGDFAIIRNVANIKSHILASGLGELFFIPLGRILLVTSGSASLRINMQPRKVEAGQAVVIPENFYMEVLEVSTAYNAQIVSFCGIPNPFKRWVSISLEIEDRSRMNSYYDLLWQVAHAGSCSQAILDNLLIAMLSDLHGINDTAEKKTHPRPHYRRRATGAALLRSLGRERQLHAQCHCLCRQIVHIPQPPLHCNPAADRTNRHAPA